MIGESDEDNNCSAWTPVTVTNNYTVTYNGNGSTEGTAPVNQTKIHNVDLELATNSGKLKKTGYAFEGWNTNSAGTATDYAVGSTYVANANLNLFAKWTSNNAKLTVIKSGAPTEIITSNPAGINCGNDCMETYTI